MQNRCAWVNQDPLYVAYHDNEWGRPLYDERLLFEFLNLEGMQAGLSWLTILKKRDNFRRAFDHFDPEKIIRYDDNKISLLLNDAGIIRNKLKVQAIIANARTYLHLRKTSSFSEYLWSFVDGKPIQNHWTSGAQVPVTTDISDQLSKDLKKRGFKFVGSTICYAFMQSVGIVNDHTTDCFCYKQY